MSGQDMSQLSLVCAGKATTVGGALVLGWNIGCVLARTGVGVVTITIDAVAGLIDIVNPATALGDGLFICSLLTNGVSQMSIADTSATIKTLSMFAGAAGAGAAAEGAFSFQMYRRMTR